MLVVLLNDIVLDQSITADHQNTCFVKSDAIINDLGDICDPYFNTWSLVIIYYIILKNGTWSIPCESDPCFSILQYPAFHHPKGIFIIGYIMNSTQWIIVYLGIFYDQVAVLGKHTSSRVLVIPY